MLCNTTLLGPYSVYPLYRTYHSSAYVLIHGMLTETHWILVSWFFQIGVPLWSVVDAFFVCVVSVVLLLTFFMWAWTCFFNPLYQNFLILAPQRSHALLVLERSHIFFSSLWIVELVFSCGFLHNIFMLWRRRRKRCVFSCGCLHNIFMLWIVSP